MERADDVVIEGARTVSPMSTNDTATQIKSIQISPVISPLQCLRSWDFFPYRAGGRGRLVRGRNLRHPTIPPSIASFTARGSPALPPLSEATGKNVSPLPPSGWPSLPYLLNQTPGNRQGGSQAGEWRSGGEWMEGERQQ